MYWESVWAFETARFKVELAVTPDEDLDLSWDDDGSVRAGLESGEFVAFVARVAVYLDGAEIAADYLGGCIYRSADEFRRCERRGYFSDMVSEAIGQAREALRRHPYIRAA